MSTGDEGMVETRKEFGKRKLYRKGDTAKTSTMAEDIEIFRVGMGIEHVVPYDIEESSCLVHLEA